MFSCVFRDDHDAVRHRPVVVVRRLCSGPGPASACSNSAEHNECIGRRREIELQAVTVDFRNIRSDVYA